MTHGQLATLNATTGAFDPFIDITVSGHHNNTGSGAQAPVGPRESGVTPAGDRLVVTGNFRTVGGLARDQIVMIDLTGATAAVSTTWYTTLYTPICSPNAFDSYMRDVEMSPDGSYFVVATTGGPHRRHAVRHRGALGDLRRRDGAHADVDQQLRRRHAVGRRDHPVGRLRRRAPALDEQPQRRGQCRPGLCPPTWSGRRSTRRPASR